MEDLKGPKCTESENTASAKSVEPKPVKVAKKIVETTVNLRDFEMKLQKEIRADERHQLINDAKLRALTQGTPTYEDFRQIWMAAHLKPMEKEDKLDAFLAGPGSKVLWNSVAQNNEGCDAIITGDSNAKTTSIDPDNMKTNTPQDFIRNWKQLRRPQAKFDYIQQLLKLTDDQTDSVGSNLVTLWKEEVPSELLSEVIQVFITVLEYHKKENNLKGLELCSNNCSHEDILLILQVMSKSRRFGITLSFLTQTDKKIINELFTLLSNCILDQNDNKSDDSQKELFRSIRGRFQISTITNLLTDW